MMAFFSVNGEGVAMTAAEEPAPVAAFAGPERRSADRPWSQPAAPVTPDLSIASGDDQGWEEF